MKKQGGFTIVEVLLVLGVSAALIGMAFGILTVIHRQRFQDTMVSLRNAIQSEYEEVRNGINPRDVADICGVDNSVAGTSNCLVMGKVIRFTSNSESYETSYVIGTGVRSGVNWPTWPVLGEGNFNDEQAIRNTNLQVVGDMPNAPIDWRHNQLKWGGRFANGRTVPSSGLATDARVIAILRSPISGAILVFAGNSNIISGATLNLSDVSNTPTNYLIALLIRNGQRGFRGAAICIDPGAASTNVRMTIPADPNEVGAENLRTMCRGAV